MIRNSSVQIATTSQFIYQPSITAIAAQRILVKPNLGYPMAAASKNLGKSRSNSTV